MSKITLPFTAQDAERASDEWGANCGPGALAAIAGLTLDQIRPHMGDFERKGYTNPTMMQAALRSLCLVTKTTIGRPAWPSHGLARIQWEGPWMAEGVPIGARYRATHWVAARRLAAGVMIFDINAIDEGGWIPAQLWADDLVPWLLKQCQPRANGKWHITHAIEVLRSATHPRP